MPAWRQGIAVGEWRQIPNTAMSAAPMAVKTYPTLGTTGPESKVIAWTGFALDTRDSSIYSAANGGHDDYAGNEVNRIRLSENAPAWTEPLASTSPAQIVSGATHYADGRPSSRHSCYGEVVNEQRDRVMILGGSRYSTNGSNLSTVDGFNLGSASWDAAATYPDGLDLSSVYCPGIVEQKSTGDIFVFATWNVIRWKNASNTWTRELVGTTAYGQYAATAHDSRRDRILIVGGTANDHAIYTPATKSLQSVTFTGLGAGVLAGDGNGMVYDPQLDAYLLRKPAAGSTVYRIDAQTFDVSVLTSSGGTNVPSAQNGVWKRFLYVPALKGTVYVPSYGDSIWFLRTN